MSTEALAPGIFARCEISVTPELTASIVGSGDTPVLATPVMITLVEKTAVKALEGVLEDGKTTVGTLVNIKHTSPTPVGMAVSCECTLAEVDRRRLVFNVQVSDGKGVVGEGVHERFIVDREKFILGALEKLEI